MLVVVQLFHFIYVYVDHKNQSDGAAVEQLWMDIHQAVYNSPSGSVLRNLACVDLQIDLCSLFTTEHQKVYSHVDIAKQVIVHERVFVWGHI